MYAYALSARTMRKQYIGVKCEGVIGLTRIGKCPTCGARVETSYTDIFFPYCKYSCKRVMQKKEEEASKRRIEIQQKKYEEQLRKKEERQKRLHGAKNNSEISLHLRDSDIEDTVSRMNARVDTCLRKISEFKEKANSSMPGTTERKRALQNTRDWEKKLAAAQEAIAKFNEQSGQSVLNAAEEAERTSKDAQ